MNRNINGADVHFNYSLRLAVAEICKRDVISEKERQARVIVFEIKAFAKPFRQLIYKAENAFVLAAFLLIHQISFKLKPDIFKFILVYFYKLMLSALGYHAEQKL